MSAHQQVTTGQFAIAMIPAIILTSGLTSLMAAKSYEIIRMANAKGKKLELK